MTRDLLDDIVIHPQRRLTGKLVETLSTPATHYFETEPVERLELGLDGIAGDRHAGFTRTAGAREPWHPRGVEIRSDRQLSLVSSEELWEIGHALGLPPIGAGWIGANLVVEGVPRFSFLPPNTRLFFPSGACVIVEAQNAPCRHAGRALARHTQRPGDEITFPKVSRRIRGLVASVERVGAVASGDHVTIHLPEQWIY